MPASGLKTNRETHTFAARQILRYPSGIVCQKSLLWSLRRTNQPAGLEPIRFLEADVRSEIFRVETYRAVIPQSARAHCTNRFTRLLPIESQNTNLNRKLSPIFPRSSPSLANATETTRIGFSLAFSLAESLSNGKFLPDVSLFALENKLQAIGLE